MEVVGHQAEAQEHDRMFGLGDGKQVEEGAVVSLFMEDGCAAISSVDDMICETGDLSAWDARHEGKISQQGKQKQRKSSLSPFPLFLFALQFVAPCNEWIFPLPIMVINVPGVTEIISFSP